MEIEDLIAEMQEVKTAHPTLELSEILKMFEIRAMMNQTAQLRRGNNLHG